MSALASAFAKLKPFGHGKEEAEDRGGALGSTDDGNGTTAGLIAGGGHAARHTALQDKLRVSAALRRFLAHEGVLSAADAGADLPPDTAAEAQPPALRALVARPHAQCPPELADRSHPLCDYIISSSHNTYLLAGQLFGKSCPSAYETVLVSGARCVEIDAWENKEDPAEPKVTHGFTLVSHIPFRAVCETIRDVQAGEEARGGRPAPVFVSLENHCSDAGQKRLAEIAHEVFGDNLLVADVRTQQAQEALHLVTLEQLGAKVCFMVEYHWPNQKTPESSDADSSSSDSSDSDAEVEAPSKIKDDEAAAKADYEERKKAAPTAIIVPELSVLGVYVQSVKPPDNSWFESTLKDAPPHHMINISETGLAAHLPEHTVKVATHNSNHMMRVYPKGTRISSQNLHPVPFWGIGAQVCALNWQTFGASMQLNEALFYGTDGYVLKPPHLRHGFTGKELAPRKRRLTLRVVGATDVPPRDKEMRPYMSCTLIHPADFGKPPKRKTAGYHSHKHLKFLNKDDTSPITDPVWDETLEWEFDADDMTFLRILLKSDDKYARNPVIAAGALRLLYANPGWNFIRLLDLHGRETACTLLVNLKVEDI
jgi:phosphatidylinositol phospholipase C delta